MSLIITIKVVPNSGLSKITLNKADVLSCYFKLLPEDGKANKELIWLSTNLLGVIQAASSIIRGLTSRKKKIKIVTPLTLQNILHKLDLNTQQLFF